MKYLFIALVGAIALLAASATVALADSYRSTWSGDRTWVGPEYWAIRWQDWSVHGTEVAVESRANRSCVVMTREVESGDGRADLRTTLRGDAAVDVAAGIWAGVKGPVEGDWKSAAAYGEYGVFAGVRPDGTLVLRGALFKDSATLAATLDPRRPIDLHLAVDVVGDDARLSLTASQDGTTTLPALLTLKADVVRGLVGIGTADKLGDKALPRDATPAWHFASFAAEGDRLAAHNGRTFGPIGWTQYTCTGGVLKLTALMMPVGASDAQTVELLLERDGRFEVVAAEPIEPMSRTATFRVEGITTAEPVRYRVRYEWHGSPHTFDGTIRAEPTGPLEIAVMSCDWGYAFPNTPVVDAVRHADPDLLVYAGDQIYEHFGKHGTERFPVDRAALDYLRKYALFGWINRDLLRDRPSIIIPDDHDNFQGNIWGAGGIKQPKGGDEMGGYIEPAAWVNAMQRTQTWHLPDAADPTPVAQGIGVYYGSFKWGGVSFAVLEDRKWKTGFRSIWPKRDDIPTDDLDALDPAGAELLGERQEAFLADWAKEDPDRVHVAISQTMFAKAHTHSGPALKRNSFDLDTNGWPRTARNRAVALLGDARAIHLVGDQHVGVLAQLGVERWTDGPLAFMVPGTANGWPRAWWPEQPGEMHEPGTPDYTGRYRDPFGNQLTILAAANPQPGSNLLKFGEHPPYDIAQTRGSGFGLVTIDPVGKTARFEIVHFLTNPQHPEAGDLFDGFPQTFERNDAGWTRRPD